MEEKVTTINGVEANRSECRRIKGKFYKTGDSKIEGSGDCYLIDGKYWRDETGKITYNHLSKEYVLINDKLTKGVVGVDENGELKMGYFSLPEDVDSMISVITSDRSEHILLNEDILRNNRLYRYSIESDKYIHISVIPATRYNRLRRVNSGYKNSLSYDSREIMKQYFKSYDDNNLEVGITAKALAPVLKGLTFGIEFETSTGVVPERICKPLGLIPLRDGSVAGLEYATIPYQGDKGIQAGINACRTLNKYTAYNEECSLHLHIGNIPRTEEFFLAMFKTLCLLQDEMYEMFPLYKKYNFGVKRKNYTQPFPAVEMLSKFDPIITSSNIKKNFGKLYEFLSMGQPYGEAGNDLANVESHPSDPAGTRKWQIKSRYHWVNLIPLLFGNKETIEFRVHTPTTDENKVMYYLFICGAIVNYVKSNTKAILSSDSTNYANLSEIIIRELRNSPGSFRDVILHYISTRKKTVKMCNHKGDIRGNEDEVPVLTFNWDAKASNEISSGKVKKSINKTVVNHGLDNEDDDLRWMAFGQDEVHRLNGGIGGRRQGNRMAEGLLEQIRDQMGNIAANPDRVIGLDALGRPVRAGQQEAVVQPVPVENNNIAW